MVMGHGLSSDNCVVIIQRGGFIVAKRYGQHQTETQVDCEWATLDVIIHWTLDRDDYLDLVNIDKITVGDRDLHEGWNVAYFEEIIHEEVLAGEDYLPTDHGD
jgi:hypothetical protein